MAGFYHDLNIVRLGLADSIGPFTGIEQAEGLSYLDAILLWATGIQIMCAGRHGRGPLVGQAAEGSVTILR